MRRSLATGAALLGTATVLAAPAQADNATETINNLRSQGYDVRVSRVGNAPLDQCTVVNVRNLPSGGPSFPGLDDDDANVFTVTPKQKVAVTLNCSG